MTETHPLPPFLPDNGRILMSGSFPPPQSRWCIDWFYPNFQNDMWRIWGLIAAGDKNYFIDGKKFDKKKIVNYCREIGLALSDTGEEVVRLQGNASDKHLQVVKPRDFALLLSQMPKCRIIALTGEKALETFDAQYHVGPVSVGQYGIAEIAGREVQVWRMPSSSRAYPKPIEWKAEFYRRLLDAANAIEP